MSIDPGMMAERRRLTRKLSLWRLLAIAAGCVAVLGIAITAFGRSGAGGGAQHVARVNINGVITGDRQTLRILEDVRKSTSAAAVMVVINSPGGTVPGSEAMHEQLRRIAEKKPVVAVVNNLAASGGYITAMGADRIVARQTALVGSIGVLFQMPNMTQLLDKVGVKIETVRSTPLKASPSGVEPTSPEARAAIEAMVLESYNWFKAMVKDRRKLTDAELGAVVDGRVFSGRQGVSLKLVDEIGSEREAIAWLEKERNIAKDLPVREWRRRSGFEELGLTGSVAHVLALLGFEQAAGRLAGFAAAAETGTLDGLIAIWQPVLEK
jgi:protease IV